MTDPTKLALGGFEADADIGEVDAPGKPPHHIVLLTPGPYNDAYFEHVQLARELGAPLAQSADLTVRGDVLYLKSLEGLVRIDVVYRRVDGDYCDSLELRQDSGLGVAGLVSAARAGNVAILNMPGSALVETPAFAPFLPALARELLGEELRLPAVTTGWRDPVSRSHTLLIRVSDRSVEAAVTL
jgi:uncharacterized circularly permuted ATP-grasp superfamily protein